MLKKELLSVRRELQPVPQKISIKIYNRLRVDIEFTLNKKEYTEGYEIDTARCVSTVHKDTKLTKLTMSRYARSACML